MKQTKKTYIDTVHYRYETLLNGRKALKPRSMVAGNALEAKGGATRVTIFDGFTAKCGYAVCSDNDPYTKKVGYRKALERAQKQFDEPENKDNLVKNRTLFNRIVKDVEKGRKEEQNIRFAFAVLNGTR